MQRGPHGASLVVFVFVAVLALPLAPFAWALLSGTARKRYLRSWLLRAGAGCIVILALPLLMVGMAATLGLTRDPNPNPIGFGLLFVVGALIGAALALVGVVKTWWQFNADHAEDLSP